MVIFGIFSSIVCCCKEKCIRSGCPSSSWFGSAWLRLAFLAGNALRIIPISDAPIESMRDAGALGAGEIGEICVRGPTTTQGYFRRPEDDAKSKLAPTDDGTLWHRMGDVGYLDEAGRLWFCGRKAHRVETQEGVMFSVRCEAIFNQHPRVYRSALVGLGARGVVFAFWA